MDLWGVVDMIRLGAAVVAVWPLAALWEIARRGHGGCSVLGMVGGILVFAGVTLYLCFSHQRGAQMVDVPTVGMVYLSMVVLLLSLGRHLWQERRE